MTRFAGRVGQHRGSRLDVQWLDYEMLDGSVRVVAIYRMWGQQLRVRLHVHWLEHEMLDGSVRVGSVGLVTIPNVEGYTSRRTVYA